ncbi:MAG: hypothetical protein AAFV37_03245 [Pseudomonadota bacterium]
MLRHLKLIGTTLASVAVTAMTYLGLRFVSGGFEHSKATSSSNELNSTADLFRPSVRVTLLQEEYFRQKRSQTLVYSRNTPMILEPAFQHVGISLLDLEDWQKRVVHPGFKAGTSNTEKVSDMFTYCASSYLGNCPEFVVSISTIIQPDTIEGLSAVKVSMVFQIFDMSHPFQLPIVFTSTETQIPDVLDQMNGGLRAEIKMADLIAQSNADIVITALRTRHASKRASNAN